MNSKCGAVRSMLIILTLSIQVCVERNESILVVLPNVFYFSFVRAALL